MLGAGPGMRCLQGGRDVTLGAGLHGHEMSQPLHD